MLAGDFGQGLAMPFGILPLLATMIGCGIWAEQLGRHRARQLPLAYLIGLLIGAIIPVIPSLLPIADVAMPVAVIVLGVLIVLAVPAPAGLSILVVLLVGLFVGYCFLGGASYVPLRWLGLVCGTLIAMASGIGLTAMSGSGFAAGVPRLLGLGLAALGAWLLFEGM
ncbi:MAG: HupE/UreJ family protein [Pseudomonadota bacterium]